VNSALRHYSEQVTRVEVHLNDINADKGGLDKRCLVEVRIAGQSPLVAEAIGGDLYGVITEACSKVGRVVSHHLDKLHDRR
jgi:ribosome-associated translation inhibitor RaiA